MKQGQGITIAVAIIGLLTLVNSYKIFFGESDRSIAPATASTNNTVAPPVSTNGANFPNANPDAPTINPVTPNEPIMSNATKTSIAFEKPTHDFGEIMQNSENKYSYTFRNTGTDPLIISDAKGTCGCTKPSFPKEPIAPGKTGKIDIVYSPGMQSGKQNKAVKIYANTDPMEISLNFTADVKPDPNAPAGANQNQPFTINPAQ